MTLKQKIIIPAGIGFFWVLIFYTLFYLGFFSELELFSSDIRRTVFLFSSGKPEKSIVFFFIDQKSLDIMAEDGIYWPWPRKMTADLIDYLSAGGARAIILDVLYTEPSVYGSSDDSVFSLAASRSGKVVVAFMASKHKNFFSDSSNENLEKITLSLKDSSVNFTDYDYSQPPLEIISKSVFMSGGVNITPDKDGIYRKSPILFKINGSYYPHISLAAFLLTNGADSIVLDQDRLFIFSENSKRVIHLDENGEVLVNFKGEMYRSYENYTVAAVLKSASFYSSGQIQELYLEYQNYLGLFEAYDILKQSINEGKEISGVDFALFNKHLNDIYGFTYDSIEQMFEEIDDEVISSIKESEFSSVESAISNFEKNYISPNAFKDKIVIVAGTAPGLYDIRPNPFGEKDGGVFIHASILDNLMTGGFLKANYDPILVFILISIMSLTGSIIGFQFKIQKSLSIFLFSLFLYAAIVSSFYVFRKTFLDFSSVPLSLTFSYISGTLIAFFREVKEKNFVRNAFGYYLSNKVVNELLQNPDKLKLGGERRFMTAFFSDIAGFTSISETMSPEAVSALLNEYLSAMCSIISRHEGIVDKFEGDAIIAFWGAPLDLKDHAQKACHCSLEMQEKLSEMRTKWEKEGKPPMKMRMGLNTGFMVVGNFGSDKRMDYTIIGDSVNLASRLEGINKFYGTEIMISHTTKEAVENDFETRKVDLIKVKGKAEPVGIFELIGRKGSFKREQSSAVTLYEDALRSYFAKDFTGASALFDKILSLYPGDGPSRVMLKRCENFIANPPPQDWTGAYEFTQK
ncbi:CHASE2 domain-containing protein [candidate division WOR-3 bacterium]|nr:CHASE2 domain-containing protein [candidate division WOR-3 bacterium]